MEFEKRFTGWVDVDLTDQGKLEAEKAGSLIKTTNINLDYLLFFFQLRANNTLKIIQETLNEKKILQRLGNLMKDIMVHLLV